MAQSTRQRRQLPSDIAATSSAKGEQYSKEDKRKKEPNQQANEGSWWIMAVMALGLLRYMSATTNILHDCDEVFNYWEPLHFLLYKSGFQTWEYSPQFALRSYLYVDFHKLVALPASWLFHSLEDEKVMVFYAVRFFLGAISVVADATLVVALARKCSRRIASYTLAMLCLTSGCFFASTSFLPSSFAMYAMSLASAFFLLQNYPAAVAVSAIGVILGWPFSILAFMPITLYSLFKNVGQAFLAGALTSSCLLGLSICVDYHYYGKLTSSVLNLISYNVAGGGQSHLYGVEGPLFYLRNGFNNFNICFVLAFVFLGIAFFVRKKYSPELFIAVSPIYIWIAFMSLQPHKEERFLYPIYPLLCVAASAAIESFPDIFTDPYDSNQTSIFVTIAKGLRPMCLACILCVSHSRTFSLVNGYNAPIELYKILEHHDDAGPGATLCVGSEWHRFPSSFFVPSYISQVKWIDDGFRGLLPLPFNSTNSSPSYFNDKNKAAENQFLYDVGLCTFLVELHLDRPYPSRASDTSTWETVAAIPFLDRELSPPLHRSFFIPYLWQHNNVFGLYKLLKRIP